MRSGGIFKILLVALIFTVLLSTVACCAQGLPPSIGQEGNAAGYFNCPKGVAIDSSGNIYVLDDQNCRVQKFSPNGTFITDWGSEGTGPGQFSGQGSNMECIAIGGNNDIYITDGSHRVQVFDTSGNFITEWDYAGTGAGQFQWPVGIAVDSSNDVYVADYDGSKILKFSQNGTFITEWNDPDNDGQFWGAWGLATDDNGDIFVTGYWNDRISEFTNNGVFIRAWGSQGTGDGQFEHPEGIVADSQGNVYVADNANNDIQEFSPTGEFIRKWDNTQSNYGFNQLAGLALDKNGNLYVANYKGYDVVIINGVAQPQQATTQLPQATAQPLQTTTQPQQATTPPLPTIARTQQAVNSSVIVQPFDDPMVMFCVLCLGLAIISIFTFVLAFCVYYVLVVRRKKKEADDRAGEKPENRYDGPRII